MKVYIAGKITGLDNYREKVSRGTGTFAKFRLCSNESNSLRRWIRL